MTDGKNEESRMIAPASPPEAGAISQHLKRRRLLSNSSAATVALLAVLYFLAWGPLLLSVQGVWWDDWTLVGRSPSGILAMYVQNGLPWVGFMHTFLVEFGPVAYHLISLVLFFVAGLALWGILQTLPWFVRPERFFIVALFLVLPLNAARHTMIVLLYTISLCLFYFAWYVLVRAETPGKAAVAVSLFAFFVSFTMNSLLVFYVLPVLHLWWKHHTSRNKTTWQFAKTWWPFLVLPFVFFALKTIWFAPSGAYEGYNSLRTDGLLAAVLLLSLTASPFLVLWSERSRLSSLTTRVWLLAFGGAVLVALALFPYIAVGHRPPFSEWSTRHEVLLPLGVSVMFLAAARLVAWRLGQALAVVFAVSVLAISIALSARIGFEYWADWRKQQIIVDLLINDDTVRNGSLIIFEDEAVDDNIFGTPYRFYAWNGLMSQAFGDSQRLGLNASDVPRYLAGELQPYYGPGKELDYGASMYAESVEAVLVTIQAGGKPGLYSISSATLATSDIS